MKGIRHTSPAPFGILLTFAAVVGIIGCQSVIDADFAAYEPELVVICLFEPDSTWTARIQHTVSVGRAASRDTLAVIDARVEILADDEVVAELHHLGDGLYADNSSVPVGGKAYTLRVSSPGFPAVVAESSIPLPAPAPTLVVEQLGPSQEWGSVAPARLLFMDSADHQDMYALRIYEDRGAGILQQVFFESNKPVLQRGSIVNLLGDQSRFADPVFSDDTFEGRMFEAELLFPRYPVNGYVAEIMRLSEEYFRYLQSVRLVEENEGNPFAEPAQPYTNVEGGRGIFAGFQRGRGEVELGEITPEVIAGDYEARSLQFNIREVPWVTVIPGDARFNLSLLPDGRVEGILVLHAGFDPDNPERSLDAIIEGTFQYDGRHVAFDLASETFVDDVRWTYEFNHRWCGVLRTESIDGDVAAVLLKSCDEPQNDFAPSPAKQFGPASTF